jgi:hypothetical protein
VAEGSPGPEDGGSGLRTEAGEDGQEAPRFHKSKNNYFFFITELELSYICGIMKPFRLI